MTTKYGLISDVHQNPHMVSYLMPMFRANGIEKIIVNGDCFEERQVQKSKTDPTLVYDSEHSLAHAIHIFGSIGDTGLEAFVQTGSHESYGLTQYIKTLMESKYQNVHFIDDITHISTPDHDLLFIPGSDTIIPGAGWKIDLKQPTGTYVATLKDESDQESVTLNPFSSWAEYDNISSSKGILRTINTDAAASLVKRPERTIAICHVPPKFYNKDVAVDMAYFVKTPEGAIQSGMNFENEVRTYMGQELNTKIIDEAVKKKIDLNDKSQLQKHGLDLYKSAMEKIAKDKGLDLRTECRGNDALRNLYEMLGITKSISAHFHESSHRAHDWDEKPVEQGTSSKELFLNGGYGDQGHFSIVTVDGEEIIYDLVNLYEYYKSTKDEA